MLTQNWEKRQLALSHLSICSSVRRNHSAPTRQIFIKFDIWGFFENLSIKFDLSLKTGKNNGYFKFLILSRSVLLRTRNISDKIYTEHAFFMFGNFFFRKSCRLWDNVEKFCTAVQATDDSMTQAHCMLDNKRYKHILRICNTLLFPNNNDCTNVPECYVTRTLPALCKIDLSIVCGTISTIQRCLQ